jgi:hypothetical protein
VEISVFEAVCSMLGYDTDAVVSVRLTRRQAVVIAIDESDRLYSATHKEPEEQPDTPPEPRTAGDPSALS